MKNVIFGVLSLSLFATSAAAASLSAENLECVATVNNKSETFSDLTPGEPDSVSHVVGYFIFDAQVLSDG